MFQIFFEGFTSTAKEVTNKSLSDLTIEYDIPTYNCLDTEFIVQANATPFHRSRSDKSECGFGFLAIPSIKLHLFLTHES